MNKDDFYYLGKISKPFGSKGQVVAFLDVDDPLNYENLENVYLDLDGEWVPFLIESAEFGQGTKVILHFEDVNTIDDAQAFTGRKMYLLLKSLPPLKGKKFYYHEVIGFTVIDAVHGRLGTLTNVMDLPRQSLLRITFGNKEILVPLVDEVIVKVDRKKKELSIHAPEGLIDFYPK